MARQFKVRFESKNTSMTANYHRYFIELCPKDGVSVPRHQENALRREQAADYVLRVGEWLRRMDMEGKVASMAITALGQVQIICDADIINHLRQEDEPHIAAIRHGAAFVDNMGRWNSARST